MRQNKSKECPPVADIGVDNECNEIYYDFSEELEMTNNEIIVEGKTIRNEDTIKKILLTLNQHINKTEQKIMEKIMNTLNGDTTLDMMETHLHTELSTLIKKYRVHVIETIVDNNTRVYRKYTEKKPMKGLGYDEKYKCWKMTKGNRKTFDSVEKARDELLGDLTDRSRTGISEIMDKYYFVYSDKYFICYVRGNEILFDINQVISVLDLERRMEQKIYKSNSKEIRYHSVHENIYKGYWLRELVDEKTMYKMVMKSNSPISVKFRDDVAEIIVELRKNNGLMIENDSLKIKPITDNSSLRLSEINRPYTCDNVDHMNEIKKEIMKSRNITVSKYINKPVMYMFVIGTTLDKTPILKIGYTQNISQRAKELTAHYNSQLYLIRIKEITSISEEMKFHKHLQLFYPNLMQQYMNETELYMYHPNILSEFDNDISTMTDIITVDTNTAIINTNNMTHDDKIISMHEEITKMLRQQIYQQDKKIKSQKTKLKHNKEIIRDKDNEINRLRLELASMTKSSDTKHNVSDEILVDYKIKEESTIKMVTKFKKKGQEGYNETIL